MHQGVKHGHAVQHLVDLNRINPVLPHAARKLGQLGVEHVKAWIVGDLVGRCGDGAGLGERGGLATRLAKLLRMSDRLMGVLLCRRGTAALLLRW